MTRAAHTAEHAFIGALQKVLGRTLSVRKVEHKKDGNTAFIVIPNLEIEDVVKAENMVNKLISENRRIIIKTYQSLEEARNHNPLLRANEERLSGQVRVVEIEGHDVAACAMEHSPTLNECEFFLATRLSKSGKEYEVDFVVGSQARNEAVVLSARMMKVCEELGANLNTLEHTARKTRIECTSNFKKLKALSREKLDSLMPVTKNGLRLTKGSFSGLANEVLVEFAGDKVSEQGAAIVLSNDSESEMAYFVIARNESINIDCNKLFKELAGKDGKGGGKPHFVTGVVKKEKAGQLLNMISMRMLS